jgi:hypothetical protein
MKKRQTINLILSVVLSVLALASTNRSQGQQTFKLPPDNLMAESESTRKRIFELRQAKDLKSLVKLADEIESTWPQKNTIFYAGLMITVCGELSSADFDNDQQYLLLRKYAKQALEKSEQMPIEQEVELVGFTGGTLEYSLKLVNEENWSIDRTERTKLWCHAWQRLEKEIDKNYNISKRFEPNYNLPLEKRRQEQEKDYNQRKLHRIYKEFSKAFEMYATDVYSRKPENTSELRYYLNNCVQDSQLRESILTKVEKNLADSQKPSI